MKFQVKFPRKHRDPNAATMVGRKTGAFKDQRNGRGGAKNEEQEYLAEYEETCLEEQKVQSDEES